MSLCKMTSEASPNHAEIFREIKLLVDVNGDKNLGR